MYLTSTVLDGCAATPSAKLAYPIPKRCLVPVTDAIRSNILAAIHFMSKRSKAAGADPNIAMFVAIEKRDIKAFRAAVARGADAVSARNFENKSALQLAMERDADEIALAILELPLELVAGELNLVWAVLMRRPDLVRRFIDAGADVNVRTGFGTPLSVAVCPPRRMRPGPGQTLIEIMHMLIDAGADVNAGSTLHSPLAGAIEKGNADTIRLLLSAGAKVTPQSKQLAAGMKSADVIAAMKTKPAPRRPAPPKLKRDASRPAPIIELEKLCGTTAFPLDGDAGAFSLHVDSRKEFDIVKVQAHLLKHGYFTFTMDHEGTRVAALPTTDPFAAIEAMGTNGDNHGIHNADNIKWMRDLAEEHPYTLTGIGFDFLSGRFKVKPKEAMHLANRMYEFCSDIVDQGTETVEALAAWLKKSGEFYFWWD